MVICSDFESTTLPIIAHTHVSIAAGFEKRSAISLLFCIEYFSYLVLITDIYLGERNLQFVSSKTNSLLK